MNEDGGNDGPLDRFDRAILDILAVDGRLPITELAQRIGLSKSPTQARLKRLIADGTIRGFRAILDPRKLGLDLSRFDGLRLRVKGDGQTFKLNVKTVRALQLCVCVCARV